MTKQLNSTTTTKAIATSVVACGAYAIYRLFIKRPACPNVQTSDNPIKEGFSMKKIPKDLDTIIIGSGIGGLSTAAILAKEGKRVLVLEQHDIAGGNLHTFTDNGYEFDTGLHYIGGKVGVKGSPLRKQFDYVTDSQVEWESLDDAYDIAISGNERYNFVSSWKRLKKELKMSFPDDELAIEKYFSTCHYTVKYIFPLYLALKMLPETLFNVGEWLFSRQLSIINKTTKEVLDSITSNQKLQGVLTYHYGDYGETPSRGSFLMNALIACHYRSGAYYPVGGPLKISENISAVIEKWGGKVLVRAPVSSILIDDTSNRAYGVVVKGKQILAKSVVSSVGVPTTFMKLIPQSHQSLVSKYIDIMKNDEEVASNISLMSMFVGISDPDSSLNLPKSNYWIHNSWDHDQNMSDYRSDPFKIPAMFISFSSAKDPTYNQRHLGKQVALVIGPCSYQDVAQFEGDRVKHRSKEYVAMKVKWEEMFKKTLLEHFPQLEGKIEYKELGTALTNDYYLGTHKGAVYGLAHTPKRFAQYWLRNKTPVKNLYLSGQVVCCGVTGALVGGYMCAYTMSASALLHTAFVWS